MVRREDVDDRENVDRQSIVDRGGYVICAYLLVHLQSLVVADGDTTVVSQDVGLRGVDVDVGHVEEGGREEGHDDVGESSSFELQVVNLCEGVDRESTQNEGGSGEASLGQEGGLGRGILLKVQFFSRHCVCA